LGGSSAGSLSADVLFARRATVWFSNIITFGLLFGQLDEGGPRLRAERGRPDPDYGERRGRGARRLGAPRDGTVSRAAV